MSPFLYGTPARLVQAALLVLMSLTALAADRARAPAGESLVFAVSEGTSGVLDGAEVFVKYEELLAYLSRSIGKRITLQIARDVKWLDTAMKAGRLDFVMASPTDYAARAIRN